MTTFAIVTPNLNQGRFLARNIESIFEQRMQGVEHWVMDGGSTDESHATVKRYDPRVRWVSGPDSGQSAAINHGWQLARGEIIAWLNADDYYRPGAFSAVADIFERHPDIAMVYGECAYVDADGQVLGYFPTRTFDYTLLVREAVNFIPQPATFLRREVLDRVGQLDQCLHFVMDFDYWLRLGISEKIVYLPKKLAAMHLHPEAKSIASLANFGNELVSVYKRFFKRPDLPLEIRNLEGQAMAAALHRAADMCFWGGEVQQSLRFALGSLRANFPRLRQGWVRLVLYCLADSIGLDLARFLHDNPYRGPKSPGYKL
jgi:glycosyltransferase involved in cell wall biosynthesis